MTSIENSVDQAYIDAGGPNAESTVTYTTNGTHSPNSLHYSGNAIDLRVLSGIIISAVIACLAGALIPSWQAARLKPVETLQVNQL